MQIHAQGLARQIGIFVSGTHLAVLVGLILLVLSGTARGQVSTASVNGVVRDPQGAVIPGAAIVLRSVETSVQHSSVSNGAGNYVILNITPGRYTIQASAKGFNPEKTDEFVLAVDQIANERQENPPSPRRSPSNLIISVSSGRPHRPSAWRVGVGCTGPAAGAGLEATGRGAGAAAAAV